MLTFGQISVVVFGFKSSMKRKSMKSLNSVGSVILFFVYFVSPFVYLLLFPLIKIYSESGYEVDGNTVNISITLLIFLLFFKYIFLFNPVTLATNLLIASLSLGVDAYNIDGIVYPKTLMLLSNLLMVIIASYLVGITI